MKSHLEDRLQRDDTVSNVLHNAASTVQVKISHGIPQGSILGLLLFLIYVNNSPKILSNISLPVLFTDDMSVIITDFSPIDFQTNIKEVFEHLNNRFSSNSLLLNSDKQILFISKRETPTVQI